MWWLFPLGPSNGYKWVAYPRAWNVTQRVRGASGNLLFICLHGSDQAVKWQAAFAVVIFSPCRPLVTIDLGEHLLGTLRAGRTSIVTPDSGRSDTLCLFVIVAATSSFG